MSSHANTVGQPKRQLTIYDAVAIIVGIVIGAGIYETSSPIARSIPEPSLLIGVWIVGGLISLIGALCYAELTTSYPHEGGDYVFLTRAFGKKMGFLFAWAGFWMVRPANIGAIAFIFARYAEQLLPLHLGGYDYLTYATLSVIVLTLINISGVQSGKWTQNLLTLVKVLGLLMIVAVGLFLVVPGEAVARQVQGNHEFNLYLAMILVLFTYGGWSNISYVAAEVIHPQRNILRSLVLGTCLVTLIYVLVNVAFIRALGMDGVMQSDSIASDVVHLIFGAWGAWCISLLICITCLGNINGMIFTNARVYYAMGQDHAVYSWLGKWDARFDSPLRSLTLQAVVTLFLIALLGSSEDAFERLVVFSAPLHWFFFLMVGIALFVLRKKTGGKVLSYKVPLYPWLPIVFCLSTGFMLFASIAYAYSQRHPEAYGIIAIMLLGILVSFYEPRSNRGAG